MSSIQITRQPSQATLDALDVFDWPIWTKEPSEFPWQYTEKETCYLLEGDVIVSSADGTEVRFGAGDLIVFPAGLSCRWRVIKTVKKHYKFG
ncbi:MAG: cupin [Deltaproteobacteria bacterium]|nr:MAG: cupin [Deltaproteobacteria bacterium]